MNSIFPAQYSTLSSTALNKYLIDTYQLQQNTTCRLLIRNVSDTYLLKNDTDRYIFKIYRDSHRKSNEIEAEVELLNILKTNGNSVSYPIRDRSGNQIQQFNAIEGIRNGILFSYAEGNVILDLNTENLIALGKGIGKLHEITINLKLKHKRHIFDFET
ncbi:MAG: homoserine kinase, partial [Flavobacterium sp.]